VQDPEIPQAEGENICGLLVHARPSRLDDVRAALSALPGAEIERTSDDGRMVVIVEDIDGVWAGDTMTQISNIDGVLSSALVYHQSAENMDEVMIEAAKEVKIVAAKEVKIVAAKGEEIPR